MERYAVVYFDTNGRGRLVGVPNDFEDRVAAKQRIDEIKKDHTKPHKVDYDAISYEVGKRIETLERHNVVV